MPAEFFYNDSRAVGLEYKAFDPDSYDPEDFLPDANYHFQVLSQIQKFIPNQNFRLVITWSLTELPFYGPDVIAYILGDEHYQIPDYLNKVGAVIKTMGAKPYSESGNRTGNPHLNLVEKRRYLSLKSEYESRNARNNHSDADLEKIQVIPLGPYKYIPQPYTPTADRALDIFFAGRIVPPTSPVQSVLNNLRPITVARQQMIRAFRTYQTQNPNSPAEPNLLSSTELPNLPPEQYSQKLASAKIALCPRGSHPESFRFFEAAHAGCILINDLLPDFWYYKNCPAIQLTNWSDFPQTAAQLLTDSKKLQNLSEQTRNWYETTVSAEAIGKTCASFIQKRFG